MGKDRKMVRVWYHCYFCQNDFDKKIAEDPRERKFTHIICPECGGDIKREEFMTRRPKGE